MNIDTNFNRQKHIIVKLIHYIVENLNTFLDNVVYVIEFIYLISF